MFGSWRVESVLNLSGNFLTKMEGVASQTRIADIRMAELSGQITAQEAAWLRHSAATEKAAQNMRTLATTIAGVGAAIGIASVGFGLKEAADLQSAVISAAVNTPGVSQSAIKSLVMAVSGVTAQSATTIAKEFAIAASSGLTGKQLMQGGMFKELAMAADVMQLGPKHLAPEESIQELTQLAHMFGAYQTTAAQGAKGSYGAYRSANLHDMVEDAVKMMSMQPEAMQKLITQGRLFIGDAMFHGVSMQEIFRQYMLMGQTGQLKGRGGAGLENFLDYLTGGASITNYAGTKRGSAFAELSRQGEKAGIGSLYDAQGRLRFVDKDGNLHLEAAEKWLADLAKYMTQGGQQQAFATELNNAFGKQGRNFVVMAISPQTQHQMSANEEKWLKLPGIQQQWAMYMDSFNGKFQYMATNFKNTVIGIFYPLLPGFTSFFNTVGGTLGKFATFLDEHRDFAAVIGGATIAITGALTVLTGVLAARMLFAGPSIAASSSEIATALSVLAGTMAKDGPVIATGSATAAGGLKGLTAALATFAARFGVGTAIASVIGLLYGAHWNAVHYPDQPIDAGGQLNRGITPAGMHYGQDVDIFGRVIPHGRAPAAPHSRRHGAEHLQKLGQHVHIEKLEVHVKHIRDVGEVLRNPLHAMNVNAPQTRTHPNVPFVFSALGHTA